MKIIRWFCNRTFPTLYSPYQNIQNSISRYPRFR